MEFIDRLCCAASENKASDLFLRCDQLPQLRINGQLMTVGTEALTTEELESFWLHCGAAPDALDYDGSYLATNGERFRVNLYRSLARQGAVLRPIKTDIPTLEILGLPKTLLTSWIVRNSGLVLVTGPTGSGKSTTLAACLEWLNQNHARHVVTIEDPIEYLFRPQLCMFTQREVGTDTTSFSEGLRRSLRQSPDVILLGEIRDSASAITALQAAETGHLVLATMHSSNVLDSLERISRLFDVRERAGVLQVLSQQLVGILSQKLLTGSGDNRVLAVEHFENQAVTRKWIMESNFSDFSELLDKGDNSANVLFLHSLVFLVKSGRISESTAMQAASNPHELQRRLRGISASSRARGH